MLTPTIASRNTYFYASGNTPATCLTRCLPQGQDAAVLSLGCGDLRNLLYTCYIEKGLPKRSLDFTFCDIDEKIIGRNILLLSLLIDDDDEVSTDSLWNIYYHVFLKDSEVDIILKQTTKLLANSANLSDWHAVPYGKIIKFCDSDTLTDARRIWKTIHDSAENRNTDAYRNSSLASLKVAKDAQDERHGNGVVLTGVRSAAPLALQAWAELPRAYQQYWKDGTVTPRDSSTTVPNPMFAALMNEREVLHYGTDPVMGFHLATAFAPLAETSPLKPPSAAGGPKTAVAAQTQFREWVAAFKDIVRTSLTLRFAVSEALIFSHTLQNAGGSGKSANLYRKLFDPRPLVLDEQSYGPSGTGPTEFDMIDTSNLDDHIGTLNILIAVGPLLKNRPWASLFTEKLLKGADTQQKAFDSLLCGHAPTVSLLLGFSPVQYWTNAKCESHVDEIFLGLSHGADNPKKTQLHSRLAWKRDDQFSGQPNGRGKLRIEAKSLAKIIFKIYLNMFEREDISQALSLADDVRAMYPHFHRASLAAMLKMIRHRVNTDWPVMCEIFMDLVSEDTTLMLASNQRQELAAQLHLVDVNTDQWILNHIRPKPELGDFNAWSSLPPVVAVTVVVPREKFTRLYEGSRDHKFASPSLVGSVRASYVATNQWHNMFGAVQVAFGTTKKTNSRDDDDFAVTIEGDSEGWAGTSPLIASFYVPTATLQVEPKSSLVGLCIPPTGHNSVLYGPILGMSMTVFETRMDDESAVYVTKFMPGQTGYPVLCGGVQPFEDKVAKGVEDKATELIVEITEPKITTITGHLDITSNNGRDLLKQKIPIELRQRDPFTIDIVFGKRKLICPLKFPIPVTSAGSRTRIARTSGYIEVITPLAEPSVSECLADFMFPTTLSPSGLPTTLNTPHLNLDNLPILDLEQKDKMKWLTTHTSFIFSAREKRLRQTADSRTGISDDPRVNFKESLFTMFMLSSGLQGGQTGMFAINHPEKGGIHMLIFVGALRLDGDTASVVLDAAVIPFTNKMIESGNMEEFLLLLRTLECGTVSVNDAELILWKKILPSLAERCRTWSHGPNCEYKRKNATIPLSLEHGQQVLCSCGNGKLPENFVGLPEWDNASKNAVRVAISPTFAVPFVEDVIDPIEFTRFKSGASQVERCRNCGKSEKDVSGTLKKCTRCLKVKYCSVECQRKDWKKHRMECAEVE